MGSISHPRQQGIPAIPTGEPGMCNGHLEKVTDAMGGSITPEAEHDLKLDEDNGAHPCDLAEAVSDRQNWDFRIAKEGNFSSE